MYHFTNVGYTNKAMAATSFHNVAGVAKDESNKAQLWYVAEKNDLGYYALRNLAYGTYLQANSQSSKWTLANTTASNNTWMQISSVNGNNVFRGYTYGNYGYAHIDGSSNIVGWETGSNPTQWNISEVTITSDIQASIDLFASIDAAATHLANLFEDQACTTLKAAYASAASLQNSADYQALPATLKAMALKIANNSWAEANYNTLKNGWDDTHAKRYRVQLYEPYNDIDLASTALSLNTHTNMNNPTGIFANNGDVLYVMVQGEIKDHATLYLSSHTGHGRLGGAKDGYELKSGLNVVPVYNDESNFYVNYVVETFDTSNGKRGNQAKARKLSNFPNLKIHIEGGYINGYYNKVGDDLYGEGDKNADWEYLEARATQRDLTILGQYMTLQFPLNDADTEGNKGLGYYLNDKVNIEDVINAWDNVMLWERLLLGVLGESATGTATKQSPYSKTSSKNVIEYTGNDTDGFQTGYGEYYNIHGLAQGVGGDTYMYGVGDHSGYHYNTMESIIQNIPTNVGSHWGPAHEIGHQHQNLINMRGEMEVSNNLFSNVVLWMFGETTSRVNGSEGSLENVLNNFNNESGHYLTNSIWGMTQMYYKLFLYYHVLGHNPKFYPRLFEMLRQDPQRDNRAGTVDGANAQLHLYKKVCAAAGEDLTEFFRAHGFFKPLNGWSINDYGWSTYNMTQEQINAAIAEVKGLKLKENTAVLFINDATGETIKSHKGNNLELYGETTICAEVGSYGNFNSEAANYTYSILGTTVTMEGNGGVGFAIYNEKGEIVSFSNKRTFEISNEAAKLIANGKATVNVVKADNTSTEATHIINTDNNAVKYALLGEILNMTKTILDLSDESGKKVGYYKKEHLTQLQAAYNTAKGVYDANTISAYAAVYEALYKEYANFISDKFARTNITEGYAYRLVNKAYPTRSMTVGANDEMFALATDKNDANQLWYLEASTSDNTYYLKNKGTSKYPGNVKTTQVLSADKTTQEAAHAYSLKEISGGIFAFEGATGLHCSESQSYNIVGWGTDAAATQWYITEVEANNTIEARIELEKLITQTENLINEMASITSTKKLELQTTNNGTANYLSTNACHNTLNNASDGQGLAGLLDESTSTFFHSDYGNKVSGTHYLQVDLGEGNSMEQFKFNYATRSNGNNCPTAIKIEGSNDGSTFVELKTFTTTNDALPNGDGLAWESPVIKKVGNYRHLRFSVTETEDSQKHFVMSTFGITDLTPEVTELKSDYTSENLTEAALKSQIKNVVYALENAQSLISTPNAEANVYTQEYNALNTHYEALLTIYNNANNAAFDEKKAELQTLIDETTTLIKACGTVTYVAAKTNAEAELQTSNAANAFYVSTNADQNTGGNTPDGGGIAALVDNDHTTYFHTRWNGIVVNEPHYFQIDLGDNLEMTEFSFTYKARNGSPAPTKMIVYGSNDKVAFSDELTTITKEWASYNNDGEYQSEKIVCGTAYRYLRFTVTESVGPGENQHGNQYFFGMLEFDLTYSCNERYSAQINSNVITSAVTQSLLITTYKVNEQAQSTYQYGTTEAQIEKAIVQLRAQKDALNAARETLSPEIAAAVKEATDFLNATPQTVGYPSATQRNAFQTAIDAHESVEAINTAKTEFINTTDIVMPENGKAYKISAWWRNETRSMEFVGTENTSIFAGSVPAYVPTTSETATIFVCRDLGNGEYAFISDNGYYLGWQADGKKNNTSTSFSVNSYNNTLKVQKAVPNNMDTMLSSEEVFGTFNILGKNGDGSGKYYHFMFKKSSKNYHSGNEGDAHYGDDAHTVFYTFEEVSGYTLNKVNLTATSTAKDKLLKGITDKQTISTFSAPYATVIPEGVTAYYASQEYDGNMLYLKAIQEGLALPANEGVILVGNEDVKASDFVPATTETVAVIDNKFSNSASSSVLMENNDYILANGSQGIGIYKAQANTRLKQGKAFLRMGSTSNAPSFIMNFGGNATGVEITLTDGATGEQVVYDLYGRRVTEVTKGRLYIVNGKKVFIK